MNRNLEGKLLTDKDKREIAITHGLATETELIKKEGEIHCGSLFTSYLNRLTQQTRYEMFWRGELKLSTKPEEVR